MHVPLNDKVVHIQNIRSGTVMYGVYLIHKNV